MRTRHTAAAVVGMWDAYRSFQANIVVKNLLEFVLREVEGIGQLHSDLCAFVSPLKHLQAPRVTGAVLCRQGGSPLERIAKPLQGKGTVSHRLLVHSGSAWAELITSISLTSPPTFYFYFSSERLCPGLCGDDHYCSSFECCLFQTFCIH